MPLYLTRKDNTYYFRQAVPAELRAIIGRREIKRSLGRDYPRAVSSCKRFAVEADAMIAEARAQLDSRPVDPFSHEGIRRTRPVPPTCLTPELEAQFGAWTRAALLETDEEKRIAGMDRTIFLEYGKHIEDAIAALRRQLAMGNVEPMLQSTHLFLIGRGYQPDFSETEWRRLAYIQTQANLQAYESMAERQKGMVVLPPTAPVLPSQFEEQNSAPTPTAPAKETTTWPGLYAVWASECERREKTRSSYLAAMKLFQNLCGVAPHEVTRNHVLDFRDALLEEGLHPDTVANKIGFVGTLIASGRNSSQYASFLTHNPFEKVKIKRSKRGKADTKRLPFSDQDLKRIFGSTIYTERDRPKGGAGEAAAWIPALAYLTGFRLEEIAQLRRRQFLVDANGNHYIHVEDAKNESSADRDVPIHRDLIDAGLIEYVYACNDRLFPKVVSENEVQSSAFSKWFGRHLTSLGITSTSKVFHSFRHLFKDLCRNVKLDSSVIDQLCGHEPGTVGRRYGVGYRIDVLADLLAKVVPPIKLPRIMPAPIAKQTPDDDSSEISSVIDRTSF